MNPLDRFRLLRVPSVTQVVRAVGEAFWEVISNRMEFLGAIVLKLWPLAATYAPAALTWLVATLARTIITEKTRALFKSGAQKKAYAAALKRALALACKEFPEHVGSLFNSSMLAVIDAELRLFFTRDRTPSAKRVLEVYQKHTARVSNEELERAASRFLEFFEAECRTEIALQELLTHRQTDESNRILRELAKIHHVPSIGGDGHSVPAPEPPGSDLAALLAAFANASRDLLYWPQTIDGSQWIDRPEFALLIERISTNPDSVSLLLGVPGAGKSALLSRLAAECGAKGWVVLAIKADQLAEEVATLDGLTAFGELPSGILDSLRLVARTRKVVLLIDQLDALSELVDLRTRRLTVLLRLINEMKDTENVHIVCSCRTFERQYDRRLNGIYAEEINLSLPPWEVAVKILEQRGVAAGAWPESFRELLRVPQYLKLFLRHFAGPGEAQVFQTYQTMLEHLWTERLFASGDRAEASVLLRSIAAEMAEQEVLFVASAKYDRHRQDIEYLVSVGVLQYDHTRRQISFTHQTLFDFACARAFVANAESLARYVLGRQTGLFIRPKVWSALHYLRGTSPRSYQQELVSIWNADTLRPHLRMLLIDFLGQQDSPFDFEVSLLRLLFVDSTYGPKALMAAAGRGQWFGAIADRELVEVMRSASDRAWPAQAFLAAAWPFARDKVLELLNAFWLADPSKHTHIWYALRSLQQWDREALDICIALVENGSIATTHVQDLASIVSASSPDLAPELIAAHLRRQVTEAKLSRPPRPTASGEGAWDGVIEHMRYNNEDPLRKIVESVSTEWYEVSAIAEAAPRPYLEQVWPPIREVVEAIAAEDSPRATEYRSDHLLATHFEVDSSEGREYALMDSFVFAARACAKQHPDYFKTFVEANVSSDSMTVHRLLVFGLCEFTPQDPAFVLGYLLGDERRLSLENFHENERETKMLIRALVSHLDAESCHRLEAAILKADPYNDFASEREPKERLKVQKWRREFRLRLLLQIPGDRLTEATRRFVESELHIFSDFKDERRDIRIHSSSSPMSAATMAKAADRTIEKFLDAFPDETGWGRGFDRDGGSIQVSRAFAEFAKEQPARAVAIIDTLKLATHERPAAYAIRDLEEKDFPDAALFDLVLRLDTKGFRGPEFREGVAYAVRKRVKPSVGLPDPIVALLERWMDEFAVPVPAATDEEPDEDEEQGESKESRASILWGYGSVHSLPSGAYPIVNAFAYGLLPRDPIPSERLLGKLEQFLGRSDDIATWNALSFDALTLLRCCDRHLAQQFLSRLFAAYPRLLSRNAGVFLIAHALHWGDPTIAKEWMLAVAASDWSLGRSAYGELLILRAIVLKNDAWARAEIERLLGEQNSGSKESSDVMTGLVHGAAHLWKDTEDRALLARILAAGMNAADPALARAAMEWFRLRDELKLTSDVRSIIEAVASGRALDAAGRQSSMLDRLGDIVDEAPDLVYKIARRLVYLHSTGLANFSTAAPLDSEALLSIALTLQRLDEPHRSRGMELFELLLQYNAYKVHDVLMDIDRRPGASIPVSGLRRRRKQRSKRKQQQST